MKETFSTTIAATIAAMTVLMLFGTTLALIAGNFLWMSAISNYLAILGIILVITGLFKQPNS